MGTPSPPLLLGFWALPPLMIAALVGAVVWASRRAGLAGPAQARRAALVAAGVTGFWAAANALCAAGLVRFGSLPPRPFLLILTGFGLTIALARSRIGADLARHLPVAALIGFQVFRVPVELLLHRGAIDGLTPPQMTYTGLNFDVVTGVLAIPVALGIARGTLGVRAAHAFNALGALLLANVVTIAALSMPTPLRVFMNEPPNTWIASAPFIGLPATLVPVAMLGHLLLWRRLRERGEGRVQGL
ncbi:MAG: hypothetical protein HYZ29_20365 [Myxococcales bacterium]|nr:hypothetical protein [Myxococcales bacterium]